MAVDYTTTALLASVRRRGLLPDSSDNLDDTDLLAMATEELQTSIAELLNSVAEEHHVTYEDIPVVAGTSAYNIPYRAGGSGVRNVEYASSSSPADTDFYSMNRLEPETVNDFEESGFYFSDGKVVLTPLPTAAGTLRISYPRRPNKLVAESAVAVVSTVNTSTKTITLTAVKPTAFLTTMTYDIIKATPSFRSIGDSLVVTSFPLTTTMTFTATLPTDIAAGDYVCQSGESPVAQMPPDLNKLLVLKTRFAALDAIGDPRALVASQMADAEFVRATALLTPRNKGRGRKIINRFGPGWYTNRFRR